MKASKIIYDGNVLIDLTGDTITPEALQAGVTAHGKDGEPITGTNTFDVDSSEVTAAAAEILKGKTAGVRGSIVTGTMPNNGAVNGQITEKAGQYTVPQGFHDGSGKVSIAQVEQDKIIPANIRAGITILGIAGAMSGTEGANPQAKTVTPTSSEQVVLPDDGYNYLSQVTVAAIPYVESENAAGGLTVTIG